MSVDKQNNNSYAPTLINEGDQVPSIVTETFFTAIFLVL